VARVGLGFGEAAVLPACYDLFSRWIRWASAVARSGASCAAFRSDHLTARAGWPASFYLFGALGLVWTLAFAFPGLQRPGP
jgi:hypothetical protein